MKGNRGAILILSFIILIALISLVGAYLYTTGVVTKSAGFGEMDDQAFWLAEAGLNKAIWYLMNTAPDSSTDGSWRTTAYPASPGVNPTDPQQESLGDGTYTIWAEDSGSNILITSRGTVNSIQRIIQQEVSSTTEDWAAAFSYAAYSNDVSNELEIKDNVTINGHVYYDYSNGSVEVKDDASIPDPYYVYADSISGDGTYTQAPIAPDPVPTFPALTTTWYDGLITTAEAQAKGDWKLDHTDTYDLGGGTVYYNGKVTIKDDATITGTGTIVATGDVKIEKNANISSNVTIISVKKIEIKNDAIVQSEAVLYSRQEIKLKNNATVTGSLIVPAGNDKVKMENYSTLTGIIFGGEVELKGDATISGAVVADSYKSDKIEDDVTINYDSSHLPSSVPTGLEGGSATISTVADTWAEI